MIMQCLLDAGLDSDSESISSFQDDVTLKLELVFGNCRDHSVVPKDGGKKYLQFQEGVFTTWGQNIVFEHCFFFLSSFINIRTYATSGAGTERNETVEMPVSASFRQEVIGIEYQGVREQIRSAVDLELGNNYCCSFRKDQVVCF